MKLDSKIVDLTNSYGDWFKGSKDEQKFLSL